MHKQQARQVAGLLFASEPATCSRLGIGLSADEQRVVQAVLDGLIVKHRTRQLAELHT